MISLAKVVIGLILATVIMLISLAYRYDATHNMFNVRLEIYR